MRDQINLSNMDLQGPSNSLQGQLADAARAQRIAITPADDLVNAVERLNAAIAFAARAGWDVSLKVGGVQPSFAGEGPSYSKVSATITRTI